MQGHAFLWKRKSEGPWPHCYQLVSLKSSPWRTSAVPIGTKPLVGPPAVLITEQLQRSQHCAPHPAPEPIWCPAPQGTSVWLSQVSEPSGVEMMLQLSPTETVLVSCHYLPPRPNICGTLLPWSRTEPNWSCQSLLLC